MNLLRNASSVLILPMVAAGLGLAGSALGQGETATASMLGTEVGNTSTYDYTITVNNTSSVSIGTFWFSWVPGGDFLPATPTVLQSPANWGFSVVTGSPGDSIEWSANNTGANIAGNSSTSSFMFSIAEPPSVMAGNNGGTPIGTTTIYHGGAFSDSGSQFVVSVAPEPSSLALLAVGLAGFAGWRRFRR